MLKEERHEVRAVIRHGTCQCAVLEDPFVNERSIDVESTYLALWDFLRALCEEIWNEKY